MECICYHCGSVFPSLAARELHILHLTNLPPFPQAFHFRNPSQPKTPQASRFILDPVQFAPCSQTDTDIDANISPFDLNHRVANEGLIFTMDPSPPATPVQEQEIKAEDADHEMIFVMDPSPPTTPLAAEISTDFPNPFMTSYSPSPRMMTFPQPAQFLPTVPTIYNWVAHLLSTGCTKLGRGCLANCVPGKEFEESNQQSRFPLMHSAGLNSYPVSPHELRQARQRQRTRLPDSPLKKKVVVKGSRVSKNNTKKTQKKSKCLVCLQMFVDLQSHAKRHEKEMRWECKVCGEKFPRRWMLEKHEYDFSWSAARVNKIGG